MLHLINYPVCVCLYMYIPYMFAANQPRGRFRVLHNCADTPNFPKILDSILISDAFFWLRQLKKIRFWSKLAFWRPEFEIWKTLKYNCSRTGHVLVSVGMFALKLYLW